MDVRQRLELQAGVISRRQVIESGWADHDIRRCVRKRLWVPVHPGVYVDHTGEPTWLQRAWAGVLLAWPAALAHDSAIRATDGPGRRGRSDGPIHLAVDRKRSLGRQPGITLHHIDGLGAKVLWNASPPRLRFEQAVLDVAADAQDELTLIATFADAVQSRRTIAPRLMAALAARQRYPRRRFVELLLDDIAGGTCSVLEHGYLTRVERPHGLPVAGRQVRASARGPIYRDVIYLRSRLVVELDGRLFHDDARARDRDLDRDLDAAVDRLGTVRLGWGQVFSRACHTAERLGALLRQRGWAGTPTRCAHCTELAA